MFSESASKLYEYEGGDWKYVINLAASTKYSQGKEVPHFIPCVVSWKVYDANIVASAKNSAAAAAAHKVAKFIHVSTGQVYASGKKASTEADPVKPWTDIARAHHEAEEVVAGTAGYCSFLFLCLFLFSFPLFCSFLLPFFPFPRPVLIEID